MIELFSKPSPMSRSPSFAGSGKTGRCQLSHTNHCCIQHVPQTAKSPPGISEMLSAAAPSFWHITVSAAIFWQVHTYHFLPYSQLLARLIDIIDCRSRFHDIVHKQSLAVVCEHHTIGRGMAILWRHLLAVELVVDRRAVDDCRSPVKRAKDGLEVSRYAGPLHGVCPMIVRDEERAFVC